MIKLKDHMKMTTRAVEALASATKIEILKDCKNGRERFWVNGRVFKSNPDAGRFILTEINDWMLAAGIVDLEIIKEARMANCGHDYFTFFEIIED